MPRKTISVAKVLEMANHFLSITDDKFKDERLGVIGLLHGILNETDSYYGFCYVRQGGGVSVFVEGQADESRRCYFSTK